MITAGIDAGSRMIKLVLWDAATGQVLARGMEPQGLRQAELADTLFKRTLKAAGLTRARVAHTIATGYGRNSIPWADTTVTEITCHARGVVHQDPHARTVVDIGGQDSKLIRLDPGGVVRDFAMNDRCAAGTGRFMEVVAARVDVPLDKLGALAARSRKPAAISSMCVVFAETEIIGLLADGAKPSDIIAGVQHSLCERIAAMAGGRVEAPVVFTGGVARLSGMERALAKALGVPVRMAGEPSFTGALGAALLAAR